MPNPRSDEPSEDGERGASASLVDAAVSGVRWMSGARVIAEVVGLGTMVLLARLIPPEEFGKFVITLIVQELALSVLGESVGSALVQRPEARRGHFQAGQAVCLAFGLMLAVATFVLAPAAIGPLFGEATASLVQLSAPIFVIVAFGTVPQAMLQRELNFRAVGLIQISGLIVRAITAVGLAAFLGLDAEALVIAGLAAAAVGSAIAIASARPPRPALDLRAARELAGFGVPAGIASISWIGFRNADYAIVGARLGLASTGIYWRAFQLAVEYQKKLSTLLYQIGFPLLSRTSSPAEMLAVRMRMMRLLTAVIFPLLAGLAIVAPTLIPWLFGPSWEAAVLPTQILVVAGAATLVIDGVGTTMMAAGRPRALLGYGWAHFAAYAGAVLVVAPMGVTAVAIAAVVVHFAFLLVAYGVLLRALMPRPLGQLWADVAPASVSSLALVAVATPIALAAERAGAPAALTLASVSVAAATAYLVVLRTLFRASWRDLTTLARRVTPDRFRLGRRREVALAGAGR